MSVKGSVFKNNKTQIVTLPEEVSFPDNVKEVIVRIVGPDRVLSPVDHTWDTFFLSEGGVTDDFMNERGSQEHQEREPFDS